MCDGRLQEADERVAGRVVGELGEKRPGPQNRLAEILAGIGREVEEVGILPDHGAIGEEGGNEACLTVQVALRRARKETQRAFPEVDGRDRARATLHEGIVAREPAEFLDGTDDFGIVETQLVLDPGVISFG